MEVIVSGNVIHYLVTIMSVATVFGVDLGTTKSVSGIVINGRVELVPNEHGKHRIASYVA